MMKYVIVGNGAAGNAAAGMILAKDPAGRVVIFSEEPHDFYFRPLIPGVIDESIERRLVFYDQALDRGRIETRLGEKIVRLEPEAKRVILGSGEGIVYDRLLMATGGSARRPPIPGMEAEGVHDLRTLGDAEAIRGAAKYKKKAVVVGAGRVGVKASSVLKRLGLEVTMLEKMDYVLPLQFDRTAGEIVGAGMEAQGTRLVLGQGVRAVHVAKGRASSVEIEDGRQLKADVIVVATGVEPNIRLAKSAGISVDRGVLVDRLLQTSIPDIYAAGDVVEMPDLVAGEPSVSGLWTNAVEMGKVAGRNMTGETMEYAGPFNVLNALEVAGIPTVSVGLTNPAPDRGFEILTRRSGDTYRKLVLKGGVLLGALLLGDIEGSGVLTGLIRRKAKIGARPEALMAGKPSYAAWLS
ncbi:MAG: FAD-dependent oxidoreductase [Thermodesulfobacteriota bacterium]